YYEVVLHISEGYTKLFNYEDPGLTNTCGSTNSTAWGTRVRVRAASALPRSAQRSLHTTTNNKLQPPRASPVQPPFQSLPGWNPGLPTARLCSEPRRCQQAHSCFRW